MAAKLRLPLGVDPLAPPPAPPLPQPYQSPDLAMGSPTRYTGNNTPANPTDYSQPGPPAPTPAPSGPPPPQRASSSAPPPVTGGPLPTREQIAAAYKSSMGRPIQENEYQAWLGNANYAQEIYNSPEAAALREIADIDPTTGVITYKPGKAPPAGTPNPGHPPGDMSGYVSPAGGGKPSGGSLSDPAYVDKLIAYYGQQPGVNPSVKNDPNYWRQQILSGHFQNDEAYLISRFMQPEGAPEGSTGGGAGGNFDLQSFMDMINQQFGSNYGGQQSGGVYGNQNLQQVGQDPFSQAITGGLADIINNKGKIGDTSSLDAELKKLFDSGGKVAPDQFTTDMESRIKAMIDSGGQFDQAGLDQRQIAARNAMERAKKGTMADVTSDLGSRGLLSEGGIAQGGEMSAIGRVNQDAAGSYAQALEQALIAENTNASNRYQTALGAGTNLAGNLEGQDTQRLTQALQTAAGMTALQSQNFLSALSQSTDRQKMLADVAARSLDQNMAWNEFLANYGLQRDQIMAQIQQGNITAMLPLIQAFLQSSGQSNQGFI